MDAEQRQAYLALEREINRTCDRNAERLAEFYRMRARRLGNARPAGSSADA